MRLTASKTLENLSYVAVIAASLLLSIVLVKRFILPQKPVVATTQGERANPGVPPGTRISLPNVDWGNSSKTVLLALSNTCRFCTESAGFYKTLVEQRASKPAVRLIAVLPQDTEQGRAYLNKLGVSVDEIKQVQLPSMGVTATPTVILVDKSGSVVQSWVGRLTPNQEKEVLGRL